MQLVTLAPLRLAFSRERPSERIQRIFRSSSQVLFHLRILERLAFARRVRGKEVDEDPRPIGAHTNSLHQQIPTTRGVKVRALARR